MLEAMRRADPAKARIVQAALINDQSFERVSDELLAAAAMAVPTEVLARYLREAPETVATRALAALPRTVAAAIQEDLSLEVAPTPRRIRRGAARDVRGAAQGAARPRAGRADTGDLRPMTSGTKSKVVAI